jgi:hypothetical protein
VRLPVTNWSDSDLRQFELFTWSDRRRMAGLVFSGSTFETGIIGAALSFDQQG